MLQGGKGGRQMSIKPSRLGFTSAMTAYAFGLTHQYPSLEGIPKKTRDRMNMLRQAYLRHQLQLNPRAAYKLPDFHLQLDREIRRYCKTQLQRALFADWDELVRDTPQFFELFNRISARLFREYQDAVQSGKPYTKHRYLSITAKRKAFAAAMKHPEILGEIELACWGRLRYGFV